MCLFMYYFICVCMYACVYLCMNLMYLCVYACIYACVHVFVPFSKIFFLEKKNHTGDGSAVCAKQVEINTVASSFAALSQVYKAKEEAIYKRKRQYIRQYIYTHTVYIYTHTLYIYTHTLYIAASFALYIASSFAALSQVYTRIPFGF